MTIVMIVTGGDVLHESSRLENGRNEGSVTRFGDWKDCVSW